MKLFDIIRDANKATDPERSIAVRVAVAITVLVSVIGLVTQGFVRPTPTAAALIGIPSGFLLSYRMRYSDALKLKALLAVALIVAVISFFGQLIASFNEGIIDIQVPLAELFLWVQVIHSLHVPARRDLIFSLASSAAMMSITAALSISATFGLFMIAWGVSLVASLALAYRSSVMDLAPRRPPAATSITDGLGGLAGKTVGLLMAFAIATFMVLPAARATRSLSFPANLPNSSPVGNPGSLSNPTLGDSGTGGSEDNFSDRVSFGYFGFADELDTSLRGRPDNTLVMRVRAPAPAFWRGQTFDTWDGVRWTASDDTSTTIGGQFPIRVPHVNGDSIAGDEFIQTFYLEQAGPNLVFGAYRVSEVYFESRFLFQQPDGALRAGSELGSDAVYTVISQRPAATEQLLRQRDPLTVGYPDDFKQFLQLPADVPQRVLDLAEEITADADSTYDKVVAIEAWMGANTTYSLDIPPLPAGTDTVDHYLFETRQGFCEQIGTSEVVMLRSLGIPARLVIGFTPGERNPLTGLFEVRASDAHSWTEVYFPGLGWHGFDPTAEVPLAGDFEANPTAGGALIAWVGERLGVIVPWVGGFLALGVILGFGSMLIGVARRIQSERKRKAGRTWAQVVADEIEDIGKQRDRPRHAHETIGEYLAALTATSFSIETANEIAEMLDAEMFGNQAGGAARKRVESVLGQLRQATGTISG